MRLLCSNALRAVLSDLAPKFEGGTGTKLAIKLAIVWASTAMLIEQIGQGEDGDLAILTAEAIDDLIRQGKLVAGSRVDLARSAIGIAVRAGAPKPDISSVDALKRALLSAKSIAYSDSASGVYVETELFRRLGIEAEVKGKSRMIPAEPVGQVVARGEAELGFQQVSELMPVAGIELVGKLPPELQKITVFAAGVTTNAAQPAAGAALIAFLASPEAGPTLIKSGLEPIAGAAGK
jgi:molybdate transport system substrate-binding protein